MKALSNWWQNRADSTKATLILFLVFGVPMFVSIYLDQLPKDLVLEVHDKTWWINQTCDGNEFNTHGDSYSNPLPYLLSELDESSVCIGTYESYSIVLVDSSNKLYSDCKVSIERWDQISIGAEFSVRSPKFDVCENLFGE